MAGSGQCEPGGRVQRPRPNARFLGWLRADNGIDFYFRQLQDMKGSVDLEALPWTNKTSEGEMRSGIAFRAADIKALSSVGV